MYAMKVVKLPSQMMYLENLTIMSNIIPNVNFSKHMKQHRFEEILSYLQFFPDLDKDTHIYKTFSQQLIKT